MYPCFPPVPLLDSQSYASSPLSKKAGDTLITASVKLECIYGAMEVATFTTCICIPSDQKEWEWVQSSTHTSSGNLLVMKHSSVKCCVGKLGDVLMLSSREKTVPVQMETITGTSHQVSGKIQVAEFGNLIWHIALLHLRNHAMSSVMSMQAGGRRRVKGTITKKATLSLYESKIDVLYRTVETNATAGTKAPLPLEWTNLNVEDQLVAHATVVNSDNFVGPDVDWFEQGFNRHALLLHLHDMGLPAEPPSLSVMFLGIHFNGSLEVSPDQNDCKAISLISQNIVSTYPTLRVLARQLMIKDDNLSRTQLSAFQGCSLDTDLLKSQELVYVDGDTLWEDLGLEDKTYPGVMIQSSFTHNSVTVIIHNTWLIDFKMSLAMLEPMFGGHRT
ncbi:hypothetical protein EDD16DRAFT_1527644 [Pisolithus croceorrhizus]|nr:hypothetical protein EDD16DRAFT_1527644 [Pisolithus croceorrhizus]